MAVGICAAVTLALTMFAFQTKIDFTAWGGNNYLVDYKPMKRQMIAGCLVPAIVLPTGTNKSDPAHF